jgi:hypothetical protein
MLKVFKKVMQLELWRIFGDISWFSLLKQLADVLTTCRFVYVTQCPAYSIRKKHAVKEQATTSKFMRAGPRENGHSIVAQ